VLFGDGRALAQSNAIIHYLARHHLVPSDVFRAAKMHEWLLWGQNSHEPYVAVCRFQLVYLRKSRDQLDPDKVRRGYATLQRLEDQLRQTRFLMGGSLARRCGVPRLYPSCP
jgi:glutathione S-transferase